MVSFKKGAFLSKRKQRKVITARFPFLAPLSIATRRTARTLRNFIILGRPLRKESFLSHVIARHSSPLYRKLGASDPRLHDGKVINITRALKDLDGIVIEPGQTFSFWHQLGIATSHKGYVSGMLLSNGKVVEGIGGGLCQLSNFLFWILLHADTKIIERYHHSKDVFPDSHRTIPFGSGATVFSNYIDLQMKNTSDQRMQLKIWLTDTQLKGCVLSDKPAQKKYHVYEKNHYFIKRHHTYYRHNELWRETLVNGTRVYEEKICVNDAPVHYETNDELIRGKGYTLLEEGR